MKDYIKEYWAYWAIAFVLYVVAVNAFAHGGRTDRHGAHAESGGLYHCHSCEFDWRTMGVAETLDNGLAVTVVKNDNQICTMLFERLEGMLPNPFNGIYYHGHIALGVERCREMSSTEFVQHKLKLIPRRTFARDSVSIPSPGVTVDGGGFQDLIERIRARQEVSQ